MKKERTSDYHVKLLGEVTPGHLLSSCIELFPFRLGEAEFASITIINDISRAKLFICFGTPTLAKEPKSFLFRFPGSDRNRDFCPALVHVNFQRWRM